MRRSIISLADSLRVCADLEPADEDARQTLRALLGVELQTDTLSPVSIGTWISSSSLNVMTMQRKATEEQERPMDGIPKADIAKGKLEETPLSSSSMAKRLGISQLTRLSPENLEQSAPAWLAQVPELDVVDEPGLTPPTLYLFNRIQQRGILSAAIATYVEEGELDMQQIITTISEGAPLIQLPRLPLPTLRRGAQVLLDIGQGMDPFAEDQRGLIKALDDVLADDRLEILYFRECPTRGVWKKSESYSRAWCPPPQGVPVIALTDVGIGGRMLDRGRAKVSDWLAFANRVRQGDSVLVCFIPYEATRWPSKLMQAMTLIHWSERTTVGAVRRALRDSYR